LIAGGMSYLPAVQSKNIGIAERRKVGNSRIHTSDLTAGLIVAVIAVGLIFEILK
jgi:hypothetical protein